MSSSASSSSASSSSTAIGRILAAHNRKWTTGLVWASASVEDLTSASSSSSSSAVARAVEAANALVVGELQARARRSSVCSDWANDVRFVAARAPVDEGAAEALPFDLFTYVPSVDPGDEEQKDGDSRADHPFRRWHVVDASLAPAFLAQAMSQSKDGLHMGTPEMAQDEAVVANANRLIAAAGEKPTCLVAANVASHQDALDFDKVFVAVGKSHAVALWLYYSRLLG